MSPIITYLLAYNQYLQKQIYQLLLFIAKFIPIKHWAFDDSHSLTYLKFKTDKLPIIKKFVKQDYQFLLEYYFKKYGKVLKPVLAHKNKPRNVPVDTLCPLCGAPHQYLYDNNSGHGQYQCKVCYFFLLFFHRLLCTTLF